MNSTRLSDAKSTDICANYRDDFPRAQYLLHNGPPEFYPILGIGVICFLFNTALFIMETVKHSKYFRGVYFKLTSRVIMMLSAFWLFAATSLVGIVFVRADQFMHFTANTFESACVLAFFDCMIIHRRAIGDLFDGKSSLSARVPPCCCFLFCLPEMDSTKRNLKRLRFAIIQLMFIQMLFEFLRVLMVFDCDYDPEFAGTIVADILMTVSMLIALWALFVLFKASKTKLAKYRYLQKFAGFKCLIIISKFMYKILAFVAKRNQIPAYHRLGAKARVAIWTNFITVVMATILLFFCRKLYTIEDYEDIKCNMHKQIGVAVLEDNEDDQWYSITEHTGYTAENNAENVVLT